MSSQSLEFYQQFNSLLHRMREQLDAHQTSALRESLVAGQKLFQGYLENEGVPVIPGIEEGKLQAITTEMNRDLRLLSTDIMFLQAARQGQTAQQRTAQMGDRLNRLIQFCKFVLDNVQQSSR